MAEIVLNLGPALGMMALMFFVSLFLGSIFLCTPYGRRKAKEHIDVIKKG